MEKAIDGCEIYMPVAEEYEIIPKKAELRAFLDSQYEPTKPRVA